MITSRHHAGSFAGSSLTVPVTHRIAAGGRVPVATVRSDDTAVPALRATELALCAMIALEFSGGYEVLAAYAPLSPYVGVLAGAMLLAGLRLLQGPVRFLLPPVLAMIVYLITVAVSAQASPLPSTLTATGVQDVFKLVIFTAVIGTLAAYDVGWHRIALAVTVPMAVISLLAALNEFVLGDSQSFLGFETVTDYLGVGSSTARHAGPLEDPNFWGRFLVAGLPLAYALVQRAWRTGRRLATLLAIGSAGLLMIGIYLTSSRGTFLAAGVATVVYLVAVGTSLLRLAAIGCAGVVLLLVPGVGSRLFTFGGGSEQLAAEDGSVLARLATQRVALAMIRDRPLVGVGPDGYIPSFGQYAAEAQQPLDRVLAPHNLYLGLWAETGLLGMLGFLLVLGVGVAAALRCCLRSRRMPAPVQAVHRPYAAGLFAGLVGWLAASVFLHLSYARIPLLLVCLAVGLWQQLRRLEVLPEPVPIGPWLRTAFAGGLAAVAAVLAVSAAPHGSTATVVGRVVPVDPHDAYLLSLRTRTGMIPSLAVVVGQVAPRPVDAQGDVAAGTVRVTATGPTAAAAEADANAAVAAGQAELQRARMTGVFRIVWDEEPRISRTEVGQSQLVAAAGAGLLAGAGAQLLGVRLVHQWRGASQRRRAERNEES